MKKILLGKNQEGEEVRLDFDDQGIHCILLAGKTGSGKSIFHNHLYRELTRLYTPDEIEFLFLDMTRVDFVRWESSYLARPVIVKIDEAFAALEELAERGSHGKITFVHIEECDLASEDMGRLTRVLRNLFQKKTSNSVYLVYSTSKILSEFLTPWLDLVDLKVVFRVANPVDSRLLLGNESAFHLEGLGERILAWDTSQVPCQPFADTEIKELEDFVLPR